MLRASAGDQEDFLVVEPGERTFEGGRGEDSLVAGLQEGVALGVDGLKGEFADLLAGKGALDLLLAHVDRVALLVAHPIDGVPAGDRFVTLVRGCEALVVTVLGA